MLLFNQTRQNLCFKLGGQEFKCDPWDSVEMDAGLFDAVKRRGLPLGTAPAAPEVRANVQIEAENADETQRVMAALERRAIEAESTAQAKQEALDKISAELDGARTEIRRMAAQLKTAEEKIVAIDADRKAAEELIREQARASADAEERRIRESTAEGKGKKTSQPSK